MSTIFELANSLVLLRERVEAENAIADHGLGQILSALEETEQCLKDALASLEDSRQIIRRVFGERKAGLLVTVGQDLTADTTSASIQKEEE